MKLNKVVLSLFCMILFAGTTSAYAKSNSQDPVFHKIIVNGQQVTIKEYEDKGIKICHQPL
ncbi:hypothetical protein [Cohnella algarum]|uniref:hypothetical protein n=1 Tax=Cohnella algarum TaxID=2044859 RepID=UPI001968929E|nr:hypothetical protein [Cohnella algarum]MBN2981096.1 hypothetical protein [Cohnella algarum]